MADPRPDLVEVVARALVGHEGSWGFDLPGRWGWDCECLQTGGPLPTKQAALAAWSEHLATTVLAALSSALMPDGGATIHEYRGNCGATRPCGSEGFIPWVAEMHTGWRTVTTYPDGSTFTSAWTETTA